MVVGIVVALAVAPVIAQQPEIFVRLGHAGAVRAIAWSPDGRTVASGGADGAVKFWDAQSGELLRSVTAHSANVNAVAWKPASDTVASAGADGMVRLWSAESGQMIGTLPGPRQAMGPLAWSPDSRTLAVGSADGNIRLWIPNLGRLPVSIEAHLGSVLALSWHPDGRTLASSGAEGAVKLWDTTGPRQQKLVEVRSDHVVSVGWNPSGTLLAAAGGGTVMFWDRQGRLLGNQRAPGVGGVFWSPDGTMLAVALPGKLSLWNPLGEPIREMGIVGGSVAWSPSGSKLAAANGDAAEIWEAGGNRLRILRAPTERLTSVQWSADSRSLLTATMGAGLQRWDAASGEPVKWYPGGGAVPTAAWSRDGGLIAVASGNTVEVRLEQSGKALWTLGGNTGPVNTLSFSSDGSKLASGSRDSIIRIWTMATGELADTFIGHDGPVDSVEYSPDGLLASGGSDGTVRIWRHRRSLLTGHTGPVHALSWSRDGKRLASAGADRTLMLWDPATARVIRMIGGQRADVWALSWNADGTLIATGGADSAVSIWNARTGDLAKTLRGHDGPVEGVAWSPDDRMIATVGRDACLRLWESSTGREIATSTLLPDRQWMVWRHGMLPFAASSAGAWYAAIRFGALRPVYPLAYYEDELKRTDLSRAWSQPNPRVGPKPIRAFWEGVPYKPVLFGVVVAFGAGLALVGATRIVRKRLPPAPVLALPPPREEPPERVVGREDLMRELAVLFGGGGWQAGLYGLPMSGKTLVVKQLGLAMPDAVTVLDCRGVAALAEVVHRDGMRLLRGGGHRVLVIENADLIDVAALAEMFGGMSVLYTAIRPAPGVPGHPLPALSDADIAELLREASSGMPWATDAIDAAVAFCGGDAYVARQFADLVRSESGGDQADVEHVFAAARCIRDGFASNLIGYYFGERLWPSLTDEERAALDAAVQGPARNPPGMLVDYGVMRWTRDGAEIRSQLLRSWLLTRSASVAVKSLAAGV